MPTDYKIDSNSLDLVIANGDFVLVESTKQHQRLLLTASPGEYKASPRTGVGLPLYLLDEQAGNLQATIRRSFIADGMTVSAIDLEEDGTLTIDASYE